MTQDFTRGPPSTRPLPSRLIPPTYPGPIEVRRTSTAGTVRLPNGQPFLTHARRDDRARGRARRPVARALLRLLLGLVNEQTHTITDAPSLKKDGERCPRTKCHLSPRLFCGRAQTTAIRPRRCIPGCYGIRSRCEATAFLVGATEPRLCATCDSQRGRAQHDPQDTKSCGAGD